MTTTEKFRQALDEIRRGTVSELHGTGDTAQADLERLLCQAEEALAQNDPIRAERKAKHLKAQALNLAVVRSAEVKETVEKALLRVASAGLRALLLA